MNQRGQSAAVMVSVLLHVAVVSAVVWEQAVSPQKAMAVDVVPIEAVIEVPQEDEETETAQPEQPQPPSGEQLAALRELPPINPVALNIGAPTTLDGGDAGGTAGEAQAPEETPIEEDTAGNPNAEADPTAAQDGSDRTDQEGRTSPNREAADTGPEQSQAEETADPAADPDNELSQTPATNALVRRDDPAEGTPSEVERSNTGPGGGGGDTDDGTSVTQAPPAGADASLENGAPETVTAALSPDVLRTDTTTGEDWQVPQDAQTQNEALPDEADEEPPQTASVDPADASPPEDAPQFRDDSQVREESDETQTRDDDGAPDAPGDERDLALGIPSAANLLGQPVPNPIRERNLAARVEELRRIAPPSPDVSLSDALRAALQSGAFGGSLSGRGAGDSAQVSYTEAVRSAVAPGFWSAARGVQGSGTVVVAVVIARNGKVSSARVVESSGHAGLDSAALSAARAAPYPALPESLNLDQLTVHIPLRIR